MRKRKQCMVNVDLIANVNMNITYKQKQWLDEHGGRRLADVHSNPDGTIYVLMGNGAGGDMKVYVPSDKQIDKEKEDD